MNFRTLKPEEIDVKVGSVGKGFYTLLLYKNARVDMTILDETVGSENWQRDHKEVKGNLYCGIGINCMLAEYEDVLDVNGNTMGQKVVKTIGRWVWKWDCGVESAFGDKEKGEASDSFKRAGFNWGIGRELYTTPNIYIDCETTEEKDKNGKVVYKIPNNQKRTFRVKEIDYNDKREITKLVIVDNKNVQVFPKYNIPETATNKTEPAKEVNIEELNLVCDECGETITEKVAKYSKAKFGKELCYDCQKAGR